MVNTATLPSACVFVFRLFVAAWAILFLLSVAAIRFGTTGRAILRLKSTCLSCTSASTTSTVPSLHYFDTSWSERTHLKKFRSCAPGFHKSALSTVVILHGSAVIHTFKNGGTSLLKVARDHGGTVKTVFPPMNLTRQEVADFVVNYDGFKAALIRDPLERVASSFHEVMSRQNRGRNLTLQDRLAFANQTVLVERLTKMLSPLSSNPHFLPQTQFMVDSSGVKFQLDYIGLADDLDDELSFIMRMPEVHVPFLSGPDDYKISFSELFRVNTTTLPDDVVRMVCDGYSVDYCCFGFSFPKPCQHMTCSAFFPA
ncbi:unnamed protein product [Prorocentrum cordatum]|uniref:Carbohydrate sulfotransferase n=1 Tax=Prorocentrum cordatum TaxID=2364126 RepID=A0ABN9SDF3_9DINO|nr:unnamed protein product [Polarella glacialis]